MTPHKDRYTIDYKKIEMTPNKDMPLTIRKRNMTPDKNIPLTIRKKDSGLGDIAFPTSMLTFWLFAHIFNILTHFHSRTRVR